MQLIDPRQVNVVTLEDPIEVELYGLTQGQVNVRTGFGLCCCIKATTMLESTPPERKAPTGTSATMRAATESDSTVSNRSAMAVTVPSNGCRRASATA